MAKGKDKRRGKGKRDEKGAVSTPNPRRPASKIPKAKPTRKQSITTKRPTSGDKSRFVYSFRYFKQIEGFGLSTVNMNWVAALLERLADLSGQPIGELFGDQRAQDQLRFHAIPWGRKNLSKDLDDLDWVPKQYRDADQVAWFQFSVSKARGRVIGFFANPAEGDRLFFVFYVVLLDPEHALDPVDGHEVRNCSPVESSYSVLLQAVMDIIRGDYECSAPDCRATSRLKHMEYDRLPHDVLHLRLTSGLVERFFSVWRSIGSGVAVSEVFDLALARIEEEFVGNPESTD